MPRTVLITGASSGIGLESAIWIARRGFRVVGTVRSEEKARAVQRIAAQARARVETVLLDVTDATEGARVIDDLEPYGLVNNAGYPAAGRRGASFDAAYERYAALLRWMQPYMQQPASGAAVVGRAMTAFLPRARYLVGCDAQLLLLAERFVPTVVRDRVTRLVLGL